MRVRSSADAPREPSAQPIFVTRPTLPPLEELLPYLEGIWERRILTNGGPLHQELEAALAEYLDVPHLSLFANGTVALATALQVLGIKGEVVTTPYSFVATAHALLWNSITPVFADVDPSTCNLDPVSVERAITPRTTAILPVHCYGTPCDVSAFERLARKYDLKVIYDAAHAFGIRYGGSSLLAHGDISMVSFHATKVFNTFEGGALITRDSETKERIDQLKNFGFVDEVTVVAAGINGKMNELQAAVGLAQLPHLEAAIQARRRIDAQYREGLGGIPGIQCLPPLPGTSSNYSYFPIFVRSPFPVSRDVLFARLRERNLFARRYFYPLITDFPMYVGLPSADPGGLRVARGLAAEVICLPIYPDLDNADVSRVCSTIRDVATSEER